MAPKNEKFKLSKSELSKAWKESLAHKDEFMGDGFEPEDGRYMVAVTNAERTTSKGSGRDQIHIEYTFLEGDYKGKTTHSYDGLDRAESLPHIMRKIQSLGFEVPEDLEDIEGVLKKISKGCPKVRILIKHKDDFRNIYIDRLMEEGDLPEPSEPEPVATNGKGKVSKEASEPAESTNDEEASIAVGMMVKCLNDDDEEEGKGSIVQIDEDTAECIVKMESGKKQIYSVDKLRLVAAEETKPAKKSLKVKA